MRLSRERHIHLWVTVVSGVAALLLGILVGDMRSGGEPVPVVSVGVGPSHSEDGVGVGFERSKRGAAAAVASYERAFATPAILKPSVLAARTRVVATPEYASTMLAANLPGARRIGSGPLGIGARKGMQTLYETVPIGYRVASYSPSRALVVTWGFTLLGSARGVEPEAYFGLAKTTLLWSGDWKIAEVRSGFGPTPKIETGGRETGGYDLLALAQGLSGYASAP